MGPDGTFAHSILDLDGTLVRLQLPWELWVSDVMAMLPSDERPALRRALETPGAAWGVEYNRLLDRGLLDHDAVVRLSQEFEAAWFAYEPNHKLASLVPQLAADGCVSVWTNNTRATAIRVVEELELAEHFTHIISIEDVTRGKPDKDGWRLLRHVADPARTIICGDSDNDILLADAVGCHFAMVEW